MLLRLVALLLLCAAWPAPARAQAGEAERRLADVKRELHQIAAERRRIEDQRGDAARRLRDADEQVGKSARELRDIQGQLARDQAALRDLQQRRAELDAGLADKRAELARLLRAAQAQGRAPALKAMLAPDSVAQSQRVLAYHRYVQADRARRIAQLGEELREVDALQAQILARREALDRTRSIQQGQLQQLEKDRRSRVVVVAQLDEKYQDRRSREQALGRDAKGLERLLVQLRKAAARAEAQRRAAAAKAAKAARAAAAKKASEPRPVAGAPRPPPREPVAVAATPSPQVGGLGWPLSGALLAGYGARMPDGRPSAGLLIGASAGAPVKAVADGTVVYAQWMTGYGLLAIVDHGNGYMSLYAYNDALLKDAGDAVKRGDTLASVGSSGGHGRPALYFELRRNGQPVDPGSWLRR
ncbi:murein hydrolase activator EnvC family protein [Agrilutibacter solisilvae]|uniref:Peptidoglycan DD-metalloendopeptidase family protein n=1 Tax=Agrilutibacter solisilvae TaxID=2763317 RepID=A0A974Y1V9_9GAMM|nr:peptidoglycan DD-metalloendopeptidase family protein [Lysobacter solisilvae]QSX79008.1 peptidoglycan DD-metalloendopeptidase family protein [Lysobacter solisilvae]